jgi:hypothetical protein
VAKAAILKSIFLFLGCWLLKGACSSFLVAGLMAENLHMVIISIYVTAK